jgi:hypothetical protein
MKFSLFIFICFSIISSSTVLGQRNDSWTSFWNKDTTLIGFKDNNGIIKIEPKFSGFTRANKFDNIMAVSEEIDDKWYNYHLTKSGKIIGRDSLYIFDNGADCESEGFIRFRDRLTDKVGMYDRTGKIAIPPVYNELTRVTNGMMIGLKNATKKFWDEHNESGCNHFSWVGGQEVLIDTMNNMLVDNFNYDKSLNFFSLRKISSTDSDTIRKSFLAMDEAYYSFIDYEKEFREWITHQLLNDLTVESLINTAYDSIIWESQNGWAITHKQKLITENFTILKKGLLEILQPYTEYTISSGGLNPFMYKGAVYDKYYNDCGESNDWIYPTMSIIISHKNKKYFTQNHYDFLRTDDGYKLISLTIRNEEMK